MSKKMMKRSLALGALMAFVITGSAMAGTVELKGEQGAKVNSNSGDRIVAGWSTDSVQDKYDSAIKGPKEFSYTVVDGNYDELVGSNYYAIGSGSLEVQAEATLNSTDITIEKATARRGYIGGTRVAIGGADGAKPTKVDRISYVGITNETNVTIKDGEFGDDAWQSDSGYNGTRSYLTSGDVIKTRGAVSCYDFIDSSIKSANTTIEKGTFNANVFGGSILDAYSYHNVKAQANVETTNLTINGGTFRENIYAGGAAYDMFSHSSNQDLSIENTGGDEPGGRYIKSNVGTANVIVNGGTFKDIYAGGLVGYSSINDGKHTDNNGKTLEKRMYASADVEVSNINIANAEVENIYGSNGTAIWDVDSKKWNFSNETKEATSVTTNLTLTNATVTGTVDIKEGSLTLNAEGEDAKVNIGTLNVGKDNVTVKVQANGALNDKYNGNAKAMYEDVFAIKDGDGNDAEYNAEGVIGEGKLLGKVTFEIEDGKVVVDSIKEGLNTGNASVNSMANIALMSWRAETNDMNKRMGELRNANGEHGVWVRAVGGEAEYKSVEYDYNQYQLGYDEKLSTDPSWTVGVALSYTDAESSFAQGSGENEHKGVSVYGSKLNADGSFIDLIAKYSRLEHDVTLKGEKGDYSTNGYSVSAEYGKRYDQGNGLWIEPQVELTYGKVKSADYKLGDVSVNQDAMESLIGRIGFSIGKDIKQGNVYARASYLYDFEGETATTFSYNGINRTFEDDLGEDWWEVGIGANINLSKATYIYADVEKTFGGEVDTNWQWNLGVRYSF